MSPINPYQKTPCVGRCSTVYGDPICRGCKRFINEISFWNQISIHEKESVWHRLDQLASRIVPRFVNVFDEEMLSQFLHSTNIRFPAHLSKYSWALHCIENFPYSIEKLQEAGLLLILKDIHSTKELKLKVQKAMYTLSLAEKNRHEQHGI